MNGVALIFRPGEVIPSASRLAAVPTLQFLRDAVGGDLELVPYFHRYNDMRCVAFCNEHGKLQNMPFNKTATAIWHEVAPHMRQVDHLVGPVIVIYGDDELLSEM